MILAWSPCHGRADLAAKMFAAVDAELTDEEYVHLVGDDFSPPADRDWFQQQAGQVNPNGVREYYHCEGLPSRPLEPPNMGESLLYAWESAIHRGAEALITVETDVIPRPGFLAAFRQAIQSHSPHVGAVGPLYTADNATISTFAGQDDKAAFGLSVGSPIEDALAMPPQTEEMWWAHMALLMVPGEALRESGVQPAVDLPLHYQDHWITESLKRRGWPVIVTNHAVAYHNREDASVKLLWKDAGVRQDNETMAYDLLCRKLAG